MTATYTNEVANTRPGSSLQLLRWNGSIYKLLYKEFLIYLTLYTVVSLVYRFVLHGEQKEFFEKLCLHFQHHTVATSINWLPGIYVTYAVACRSKLGNLPSPNRLMMIIRSDVETMQTMQRYIILARMLTYSDVSTVVKKGFVTEDELKELKCYKNEKYLVPLMWLSKLVTETREKGQIKDDMTLNLLNKELDVYRGCCERLNDYMRTSVPLTLTQLVTLAVYMFSISTLLSGQYLDVAKGYAGHNVDIYVPIFPIAQFFVYVGLLKVAEQLINPFGEDDDDFKVNFCIDRNHEVTKKDKFCNDPSADKPCNKEVVCTDDTDDDKRGFVEDPVSRVQNENQCTPKEINVAARTTPEKLERAPSPQLLPNPSGNEVDGTDNTTPKSLSNILEKPNLNEPTRGGACGPGTSPHDVTMSSNENIRQPVPVVSNASPSKEICVILEEEPHDPASGGNHGNNPPSTTIDVTSRKPGAQKGNHPAMQLQHKGATAFVIGDDEEYGETQTRIRSETETSDVTKISQSPVQKENQLRTAPKERKAKAEQKGTIKKIPEVRSPAPPPRPEHPDNSFKSLISSPSGDEGDGTDNFTTPISPLTIFDKLNLDQPTRSGVWGPGASPHDITMLSTKNFLGPLQVVPSSSPSAASSPGNHSNNLPKIELELDELVLEADKKDTQPSEEAKFLTSELHREEETSLIQIAVDEPDDEESLDSKTPLIPSCVVTMPD